jgi:Nickel responsive protein SCO4226-like
MDYVIVERHFEQPISEEAVRALARDSAWCQEMHRARLLRSYLSADGLRMICLFEAPDAESVRIVNRTVGAPFDSVWNARLIESKS